MSEQETLSDKEAVRILLIRIHELEQAICDVLASFGDPC